MMGALYIASKSPVNDPINTVKRRVVIRPDFQDLQVVILDFVQKGLVADTQILGGPALVATVGCERGEDFFALDEAEGAVAHVGECARKIELFHRFVLAWRRQ